MTASLDLVRPADLTAARRIRRFLLWLLPARRVKIPAEPVTGPWRTGSTVSIPGALGDWDDLPYK